jgi:predicted Zn-dependent protease
MTYAVVLSTALLPGCRTVRGAQTTIAQALISPQEEKQLGAEMASQIQQQVKLLDNPSVVDYVRRVGDKVVASADNRENWKFTFNVVDDPNTVNAFSIPGGGIYVYSGLLAMAQNEAQLAGVLAHEVAHVTSRHMARRLVETYGLQTIAGVALGQDPNLLEQIAAAVAVQGTLLKNSRGDESQADSIGVVTASQAGYDPRQMVAFFQLLLQSEGNTPRVLTFLSDHPATQDRIKALDEEIAQKGLTGDQLDQAAYQRMQKQI